MDGHECTEILYSQLNAEFRIDAEYFYKTNLEMQTLVKSKVHVAIGDIGDVTDGIHTSIDYDENSGINLISATSPRQNVFNLTRKAYISEKAHNANPRTALRENDVILSTVGTIGNCAVVDRSILPANSDRHVGIIRLNSTINPYVLSTFLLTKYGRNQTVRETTGNVQPNLFLYKIKEIIIPVFAEDFQITVRNAVLKAQELLKKADTAYRKTEQVLERVIGIDIHDIANGGVSVKTLSESFGSTGRLDAEYYQPKYSKLIGDIEKVPHKKLREIVTVSKSVEPGSEAYCDEGIPFIRISDISKYEISEPDKFLEPGGAYDDPSYYLKKDEILFSKDGSVAIAYKVENDARIISSSALLHLVVNDYTEVLPDYLTVVLNSEVVQLQAERDVGGSIIKHWKPSEIGEVLIPVLEIDKQKEISDRVIKSFKLRRNSKKLLEDTKKAVEMAIEKGEAAAIVWLNGKIKELTEE